MHTTFPLNANDEIFLTRIISKQPYIFFQFSVDQKDNLKFDYLNGNFQAICEVSFDDFANDPWMVFRKITHPKDKSYFLSSISSCIQKNENLDIIYRIITPSGKLKWLHATATIQVLEASKFIFCGVVADISIQKEQEEQFKILELRSQFANLASGIGVWDWNMVTNEVFYSAESLKILEIDNANPFLISNPKKWDELVHPEDKEQYFGTIQEHFDGKIPYYETYHRVYCKDRYKWILDRGKVIARDENGAPLRIIGTHTDVTSTKKEQAKLEETLALVNEQKSKLLNFAHIVSHNLKNHAGNFSSILELFKENILTQEETFESLEVVAKELSSSLENLVDLVNIQESTKEDMQSLSLAFYFDKVLLLLQDTMQNKQVTIYNRIAEDLNVLALPAYLESILLNLTTNAIKYSDPTKNSVVAFSTQIEEEYLVLLVEDNGLGMDMDKYGELVFGLYKTFHQHEDSSGIGLYITKNQIEAMGGKITVESNVGVGTTFKVYFKK